MMAAASFSTAEYRRSLGENVKVKLEALLPSQKKPARPKQGKHTAEQCRVSRA